MKRKIVMMLVLALSTGLLLTGCQKETEAKKEPEKVEQTEEKKEEELKFIGTEEEGSSKIILENKTGKDIKGIAVKKSEETEFGENLLAEADIYQIDEKRYFCYKFEEAAEIAAETSEDAKLLIQGYDIQLTFADDTAAILHGFPFQDMKEGTICFEEETAYLMYESVSTKEEQNTKETEEAVKAQKEAEEAAAAEQAAKEAEEKAAAEQAAKEAEEKAAAEQAAKEAQEKAAAEQAAKEAQQKQTQSQSKPQPKPAPQPEPEPEPQPEPEVPQSGGGEGCLDDGLFY